MSNIGISSKRVFKSGVVNFFRNKTVSISSISILTVTLLIIGTFFFFRGMFNYSLTQLKNKVDIKIYFKTNAPQNSVNNVLTKIKNLEEVNDAYITNKEDVLDNFRISHANEPVILEALKEVGENPFGDMITIIAKDTNSYESISNTLNYKSNFLGSDYDYVDKANYLELKPTIDRLNNIIKWVNLAGYWIIVIFLFISALIVFNTIRLSIFIYREEISIMKLVGASNMYVRGPFIIESSIYALVSTILTMIILFPITYFISKDTIVFFEGLDLFKYYTDNILILFLLLLIVSVVLCFISSLFAIRKYLKK